MIIQYEHHGAIVSVQADLKGQHRDHCLCFVPCAKFKPGQDDNCPLAEANYQFCVENDMVLPVWECRELASKGFVIGDVDDFMPPAAQE